MGTKATLTMPSFTMRIPLISKPSVMDSWPIANVLPTCHFVFSCSAQLQLPRPNKTGRAPTTRAIFGSAPSVVGR